MLIKAQKELTRISDDEKINNENYIESLCYIDNLYIFINKIKNILNTKDVIFLPSFKGKYTSLRNNLISNEKENEMKIINIKSQLFFEESIIKRLKIELGELCEKIIVANDTITFILN